MWDAVLLVVLLAGVEDADRTQELVQLARGSVVVLLREETRLKYWLLCRIVAIYCAKRVESLNAVVFL